MGKLLSTRRLFVALIAFLNVVASSAEIAGDKSGCALLSPTPTNLLREFSTDRPDKTESPYTVDAGHFQIEMDLLDYSYDEHNPARQDIQKESLSAASLNLKVGLLNDLDAQLIVPTFNHVRTHDRTAGTVQKNSGFGDATVRTKWNVWGNDGGRTAFGVMPFVKFPTSQDNLGNGATEGGLILPLAIGLPHHWDVGLMTELDINQDGSGRNYHPEFVNSITFSHGIVGKWDGYAEFFSSVSAESGSDWVGTVDFGLVYALTEQIHLDGGINVGVTRAADDFNPFVGMSVRF